MKYNYYMIKYKYDIKYNYYTIALYTLDGYPMQDIVMKWKGNSLHRAIHGVDDVEIPQFTIEDYRIGATVETSMMGMSNKLQLWTIHWIMTNTFIIRLNQ